MFKLVYQELELKHFLISSTAVAKYIRHLCVKPISGVKFAQNNHVHIVMELCSGQAKSIWEIIMTKSKLE